MIVYHESIILTLLHEKNTKKINIRKLYKISNIYIYIYILKINTY
jgi:hypothetical protein